ncbi:MAG: hypothetical protein KGL39_40715 [Patescibacteria group bacterium]|nr:hypothetical protein [Patescibacteria group bacterium]
MTYQNKVALAIKCGGKVLREQGETVTLPWGSEYSVLIKNMHSCRILAKFFVDGKDATEGTHLVVPPNESIELERYIRNGNRNEGNAFKFVERTPGVEASRGITIDDGFVRVEFQVERVTVTENVHINRIYHDHYERHRGWPWEPYPLPWQSPFHWGDCYRTIQCSAQSAVSGQSPQTVTMANVQQAHGGTMNQVLNSANDAGFTVPGRRSTQQFAASPSFSVEQAKHSLVLRLRGELGGKPVEVPLTVQTDLTCSVCYKRWPGSNQFCASCGAALVLI